MAQSKTEPAIRKLLARSDDVIVKNFYSASSVSADKDPKYPEIVPANVSIQAIWAYPFDDKTLGERGASIEITNSGYFADGDIHGFEKSTTYLDLDELKDFDSALAYFQSSQPVWNTESTNKHVESAFATKDGFSASVFRSTSDDGKPVIYLEAQSIAVALPFARLDDLKAAVDTAIQAAQSEK